MIKSATEKIKERRKFPRIKDIFFASFQSREGDMSVEAITKDISQGGLSFKTSNFIPERTELKLEIYQPLNYNNSIFLSIPVKVRIVWIRQASENNENFIGVKITKMSEGYRDSLAYCINDKLKKS